MTAERRYEIALLWHPSLQRSTVHRPMSISGATPHTWRTRLTQSRMLLSELLGTGEIDAFIHVSPSVPEHDLHDGH